VPLYEYECVRCGQRTERIEKFSGPHLRKCPKCGGKVEQLMGTPAVQFKGSGWYVTDYARKTPAAGGKAQEGKESKESKESKETKETKEKKDSVKETPKPASKEK